MGEVKRFVRAGFRGMVEQDSGRWVKFEDYASLQQKLDAMAAENGYLKDSVAMHAAGFSECSVCGHEEPCETHDIVWMAKETTATDAYLNSVRAEGVQDYANDLRTAAIAAKENGHDMTYDYLSSESDRAGKYAQRLRSGTHDTADKAG